MSIVIYIYIYICVCVCVYLYTHTYKDQKVSVLLQVSHPADWSQHSLDLSQCAEDMDLTTQKWRVEEMCKLRPFIYSMLTSPKNS